MSDNNNYSIYDYLAILITLLGAVVAYFFIKNAFSTKVSQESNTSDLFEILTTQSISQVPLNQQTDWTTKTDVGRMMNKDIPLDGDRILTVSNRLHDLLQNRTYWRWSGRVFDPPTGQTGPKLLDDKARASECMIIAHALVTLVNAKPTPYGLDQKGSVRIDTYNGDNEVGFIAAHKGEPLRNPPNMYDEDSLRKMDYYLWSNHKTVQLLNTSQTRYYDPSYAKTQEGEGYYTDRSQMAKAQIAGQLKYKEETFNVWVHDAVMTDTDADLGLRGFYLGCAKKPDRSLVTTRKGFDYNKDSLIYIGPFNGQSIEQDFGFDPDENYLNDITRVNN